MNSLASNVVAPLNGVQPSMCAATSFHLNLIRIGAALVVFANHVLQLWYPRQFGKFYEFGHKAVILFFVLSGYVIAYSTLSRRRAARDYFIARLGRLYSVVLPALVLTAGLLTLGMIFGPDLYVQYDRGWPVLRFLMSAFFLQEVWTFSASPASNQPLWSLSYEAAYYLIFGAWIFVRRAWWRGVAVGLVALLVGPKILLLLPIWLLGVAAFHLGSRLSLPQGLCRIGYVVSCAVFVVLVAFVPEFPSRHGLPPLFYSSAWLSDFGAGLAAAMAILMFNAGFATVRMSDAVRYGVNWTADHTFSLYLYHFPLLFFAAAVVPFNPASVPQASLAIVIIFGIILGLSSLTESRRQWWNAGFARLWDILELAIAGRRVRPVKSL